MGIFSAKRNKNHGSVKSRKRNPGGLFKKTVIVTGLMLGLFMVAPMTNNSMIDSVVGVETAYAAETYSDNWKIDESSTWWYYLNDGTLAKNCWVEDHGQWYLLGSDGAMRTGVVKSNGGKYYLLDTVRGTGTYGKMLKNGSVYNGVTIKADTSEASEGALSQETIDALKGLGIDFNSVPNVENTNHVKDGVVVLNQEQNKEESQKENPGGVHYSDDDDEFSTDTSIDSSDWIGI